MPRFQPGQSGNPKGRPLGGSSLAERIRARCGDDGDAYVDMLHGIAMDDEQPMKFRVDAVKILLDRGFGRPPQEVQLSSRMSFTDEQLDALPTDTLKEMRALMQQAHSLAVAGGS